MFYSYGISQRGAYHIKNDIVCQDYHFVEKTNEGICFAVVADGLGSEKYTDIASRIACEAAVKYCKEHICKDFSDDQIIEEIRNGFRFALDSICEEARINNQPETEYDTTLAFAVFIDSKVIYGQSGDSGIIALLGSGEYVPLTRQQRDENGFVYPLAFTDHWEFGVRNNVASILLVTDGIWETLFPCLLRNEEVKIYVVLAQYLMDNKYLEFEVNGEEAVFEKINKFISSISENQVSDDKTVVCVVNSDVTTRKQSETYYAIPDWENLKKKREEEFRRIAYPHLYNDKEKE